MKDAYQVVELTPEEQERLRRAFDDLLSLASGCRVPAVRAHAVAALAQVAQALNGEGLAYELYSNGLTEPATEGQGRPALRPPVRRSRPGAHDRLKKLT